VNRRLVAVPLALLLAGCGSTVQVRSTVHELGTTGELGLPGPAATTGTAPTTAGGVIPSAPGGTLAGPAATGAATLPSYLPSTATGTRRTSGPGYSATEIRLGFSTSNDAGKALGAFGLSVAVADQQQLVRTWLDKVNAEGGIAGRRVVPVFYDYKATGDLNTSDQAACETWTRDNRVFAATGIRVSTSGSGDVLTPCLAKAGVPWLAATGDERKWQQYPQTMFSTADMNRTREARVLVESLAAQGFFTRGAKVGVIINDTAEDMSRAVHDGMEPALARIGLTITKKIVISNAWTESSNAELQMFTSGVTHVLFAAPGGAAASQFMNAAQSQRRTYEYGISTQDAPGAAVQALAPAAQLRHARGYGYRPGLDVDSSNQPPETAGMKACFAYYRSKGFSTTGLNPAFMALVCDSVELVRLALRDEVNPAASRFVRAVEGFGTRLPVASTFTSRFSPHQHDGVGSYRFLQYLGDCSCFRYAGPLRADA
jgi:ABC-type branched-subunit amino acid transport system substrate-binding protein